MEQNGLTQKQKFIFQLLAHDDFFTSTFYLTGGTALSAFYLHHRESEDLDFFSEKSFTQEFIESKLSVLGKTHNFTFTIRQIENVTNYILIFTDKEELKVDFVSYPHRRLFEGIKVGNFTIDSKNDIAINKMLTIMQRTTSKDFVDLYFLLQEYSLWDLINGLERKFNIETDQFILASDFAKVEQIDVLPKMLKSLTLGELQAFFREEAKKLAKRSIE